jgi:uncharacterized protein YbbC (DUF1343 family)
MFERYTEKARRVIFFARYEASMFGSKAIEPEHLLLGIAREDSQLLKRFIKTEGFNAETLRTEIASHVKVEEKIETSVQLPLATETKRILAYAHEESERLLHSHIGTEHFLLALLREPKTLAAKVLRGQGVELEEVLKCFKTFETHAGRGTARPTESYNVLRRGLSMTKGVRPVKHVTLGLEKLLENVDLLRGERVGLICNQSSVDHGLRHAADLLHQHEGINLTTLFGPQHGIRGDVQDNMVETGHSVDSVTGLPIYSLYSETREPTEEMLENVDALVFDMQDVGCRIYTFIYTMANCMRAAKRFGKRVVVCDRPNPITGSGVAGNILEPEFASFVGQFPLPTRHGMTVCELARLFNGEFALGCELETVTMEGWEREMWMDETDAPWVMPSPNMPTLDTATVFPGTVHLEGTQMSEGRGTTRPFEIIGAPYIDASPYSEALNSLGLPGVYFRACGFQPTFQKHAGQPCGGVQIHVLERASFEPVMTGVATVLLARKFYGEKLRWKEPPYEYVFDKNPFDVIAGTQTLRAQIERGSELEEIVASWQEGLEAFMKLRAGYLLY